MTLLKSIWFLSPNLLVKRTIFPDLEFHGMSIKKSYPLFIMEMVTSNHGSGQSLRTAHWHHMPQMPQSSFWIILIHINPVLSLHAPHLMVFLVTSLSTQLPPFHACFECGLKEPQLVLLLLACTLCNNDSGSFPKLPGATLPSSSLYMEERDPDKERWLLVSGMP